MSRLTPQQRLARLQDELNVAGHRAYSIDNIESKSAVKAFEKVEKLKEKIKALKNTQEPCSTI